MNVVGKLALQELKELNPEVFKHAVIAGGMVRDHIMNGPFRDIDIIIPKSPKKLTFVIADHKDLKRGTEKKYIHTYSLGNFVNISFDSFQDYGLKKQKFSNLIKCKFMGIDCDLIEMDYPNDDQFGARVISDFNYWIDQAYWDGQEIMTSDGFKKDINTDKATLCRLDNILEMPGAINKFNRLLAKYPKLKFNSTIKLAKG